MTKWGTAPWQTRLFLKHRGRLRRLRNICAEHSILDGVRLGNHPFYRCPLKDLSEHRGTPFRQLLSLKMSVRLTALTSANRADEIYAAPRAALQTPAAPDRRTADAGRAARSAADAGSAGSAGLQRRRRRSLRTADARAGSAARRAADARSGQAQTRRTAYASCAAAAAPRRGGADPAELLERTLTRAPRAGPSDYLFRSSLQTVTKRATLPPPLSLPESPPGTPGLKRTGPNFHTLLGLKKGQG